MNTNKTFRFTSPSFGRKDSTYHEQSYQIRLQKVVKQGKEDKYYPAVTRVITGIDIGMSVVEGTRPAPVVFSLASKDVEVVSIVIFILMVMAVTHLEQPP